MSIIDDSPSPGKPGTAGGGDFLRRRFAFAPPELYVLLWTLKRKTATGPEAKRSHWLRVGDLGRANDLLAGVPDGTEVYSQVALSPRDFGPHARCEAGQTAGIAGLWADIDIQSPAHKKPNLPATVEEAWELATSFGLTPTETVHSGHGLQPWWLFKSPWVFRDDKDRAEAAGMVRRFQDALRRNAEARGWSLDSTHDLARVLRVPGTVNYKGDPVPVTLLGATGPRYDRGDFAGVLSGRVTRLTVQAPPSDREVALEALSHLNSRRADDYGQWVAVGMALHSVADDLLADWDRWSKSSAKYEDGKCREKWATFTRGDGVGLGSLVHWAREDGWQRPGTNGTGHGGGSPPPGGQTAKTEAPAGWEVIRDYFRRRYGEGFRVGEAIFSPAQQREVRRQEACAAMPPDLMDALGQAANAPRDKKGHVNEDALPGFFRKWAGTAWVAYHAEQPEEDGAKGGAAQMAGDEFRRLVRQALLIEFTLSRRVVDSRGHAEVRIEHRSAIAWCQCFAKVGPWRTVRSKQLWCREEGRAGGEVVLRVAIRHELFGQLKADRRLVEMKPSQFMRRAARYGVGRPGGQEDRAGGRWVLVLADDFVADLTATLCDDSESCTGGQSATSA